MAHADPPGGLPDFKLRDDLNRRFRRPLITYFLRRSCDHAEAEDMAQVVFARILRHPETHVGQAKSYIFTIAANLLRDRARQQALRQVEACGSFDDPAMLEGAHLVGDFEPERVLLGKDELREVLSALNDLGERTKDIFILYRLEKMKHDEIALLYGISRSAVEKHVAKAVAYLAAKFGRP